MIFPRVHLLGRLDFEVISKYILLSLSTANTKIQRSTTVQIGGGGSGGRRGSTGRDLGVFILLGIFIFSIATTDKISCSPMLTQRKRLEG